jgi:hypothetical protein
VAVPAQAPHGLPGAEQRSGWQLAQRAWQDSGVTWEAGPGADASEPGPYRPEDDPYAARAYTSAPHPYDTGMDGTDLYPADTYRAALYAVAPRASAYGPRRADRAPYEAGRPSESQNEASPYGNLPARDGLYTGSGTETRPYEDDRHEAGQYESNGYQADRSEAGLNETGSYEVNRHVDDLYRGGHHVGGRFDGDPDEDDSDEADPGEGEAYDGDAYDDDALEDDPYENDTAGDDAYDADTDNAGADKAHGVGPEPAGRRVTAGSARTGPQAPPLPRRRPGATWSDYPPGDFAGLPWPEDRGPTAQQTPAFTPAPEFAAAPSFTPSSASVDSPAFTPSREPADPRAFAPSRETAASAVFTPYPEPVDAPAFAPSSETVSFPAFTASREAAASSAYAPSSPFASPRVSSGPRSFAAPRSFPVPPLSAPVAPPAPVAPSASAPTTPRGEPDELFRAWQGSVREASGGRGSLNGGRPAIGAAGRGRGWQAAKIGVPAVVIVTVGAGALLMLTGRANEMLAERASVAPATSPAPAFSASLSPVPATLAGYPGQHGTVGVAGMWSADGLTVAVGSADNHPAVWRRAPDGNWTLVSAPVLGGLPGHLTSVSEGPLGWVAVGSVTQDGTDEPMAYQSADGVTWSPLPALTALAGSDAQFLGVAAGPGGYLVVGRQGSGKNASAGLWWSGDLRGWSNGGNSGNTGSVTTAAVSVGNGFAAVGSENSCHTIWTSPDGKTWTPHDLAKPDGAQTATLRSVATGPGGRIVAAGFAVKSGSALPIVVASADGGAHLTQIVLSAPAGPATVTAVTATSDGFVAAGLAGPSSAQHAVTWTSPDGLTWSAAKPLSAAGSSEVTALTDTSAATTAPTATGTPGTSKSGASTVTGTAQHGASPTLLTVPAP